MLKLTNEKMRMANVIEVNSYLEAVGVVLALREGISLESIRRPIQGAKRIDLPQYQEGRIQKRGREIPVPPLPPN